MADSVATRAWAAMSSAANNSQDDGPVSATDARESDPEDSGNQKTQAEKSRSSEKVSAFKSLGWLDRFLAVWILLAMIIGVLLGNFVPETGPALQKGKFVGVSVPIGKWSGLTAVIHPTTPGLPRLMDLTDISSSVAFSCRASGHDVSHPLQGPIRIAT